MASPEFEDKTNPPGHGDGTVHVENGQHLKNVVTDDGPTKDHKFQPPELVRKMTPEERAEREKKLVRKIDLRLLPMIILMYILNYIDRYAHLDSYVGYLQGADEQLETISQRQSWLA